MDKPGSKDDRRGTKREQIARLMPVNLTIGVGPDERAVSACLYDVSPTGICLILREPLPEAATATLVLVRERIVFSVTWIQKDAERAYRCGLRLTEVRQDLRELFSGHLGRAVG